MLVPNDSIILQILLISNPDLIFDEFVDFENFNNNYEVDDSAVVENQDDTYSTILTLKNNVGPDIKFDINSTLCNNNNGLQY